MSAEPQVCSTAVMDPGTKMFEIGGDRERGLGSRFEEEIVDHGFILIGDIGDPPRQREYDVG